MLAPRVEVLDAVVRMIVCARESRLTSIAQTRLASSRGLQPMSRSASSTPARRMTWRVVPSPSTVLTSKRSASRAAIGVEVITVISCSECRAFE